MPKETILEYLADNKKEDNLRFRLVMQSAPLLKGVKMSCIFVVAKTKLHNILYEFQNTGIEYAVLHKTADKIIVFLYRRKTLVNHLGRVQVQSFLKEYGYNGNTIDDFLPLLKERVAEYYEKKAIFPHEIGVFLGYPIEDVKGFIENAGKNFLLSGYWKVYSNMQRAKELFRKYDEAKDKTAKELFAGKKLYEIAG